MWPTLLIILYCAAVAAASLVGGWLPAMLRMTHTRMQLLMSFVGGLMLGVALLHLLPHASVELESLDVAMGAALTGLLGTFLLMRLFHFHQHDHAAEERSALPAGTGDPQVCDEPHEHLIDHLYHSDQPQRLSWLGLFFGLAVHTLIDGVALAASVVVTLHDDAVLGLAGLGTFLAILLHKPLDAFSITSVMVAADWQRNWIGGVNLAFAMMCPLGALGFYFGVQGTGPTEHVIVGSALGFAAGVFLCISLADILPEVQFHRHDRVKLSATLLAGVGLAFCIGLIEPEHAHSPGEHRPSEPAHAEDHRH